MAQEKLTDPRFRKHPWRDKDLLRRLYFKEELTQAEIADRFGCTPGTIHNWLKRHRLAGPAKDINLEDIGDEPWKDEELLRRLYIDKRLSTIDVGAVLGCVENTVCKWLRKHDIPVRENAESIRKGHPNTARFRTTAHGYEAWKEGRTTVLVHRLLAISEFGYEAVTEDGIEVHHENELTWGNWPDNLKLMATPDHMVHHTTKLTWEEKLEIAERYENGDESWRSLAPDYDVSASTIGNALKDVENERE